MKLMIETENDFSSLKTNINIDDFIRSIRILTKCSLKEGKELANSLFCKERKPIEIQVSKVCSEDEIKTNIFHLHSLGFKVNEVNENDNHIESLKDVVISLIKENKFSQAIDILNVLNKHDN